MSEYIDDIEIADDVFKIFYQEATEEEKEERIKKEREDIERRGYLPVNDEFEETMTSPQEVVEKNPRKYHITSVPALKVFKNGKITLESSGVKTREELSKLLAEN